VRGMDTSDHSIMAFLWTRGHVRWFVGGSSDLFIFGYVYNVFASPFCLCTGNVVTWCHSQKRHIRLISKPPLTIISNLLPCPNEAWRLL
jgi:hypothetical protein